LKYAHTRRGKKGKTIKIKSVGRTEKHKLITAIIAKVTGDNRCASNGIIWYQTVFLTGLDKYITE